MMIFYRAIIESVIRYGIPAWYGNLSIKLKAQINKLTNVAMKLVGIRQYKNAQEMFEEAVLQLAQKIIADPEHVLHAEYQLLPSGRRYRVPMTGNRRYLNRFKRSFVPLSITLLNAG